MNFHINFWWLFGGCLTGQLVQQTFQWTFQWTNTGHRHEKCKELIIIIYILIIKQVISEFCILGKGWGMSHDMLKIHAFGIDLLSLTPHYTHN